MPTALLISPHLDDVAFSCGGVASALSARGWNTVLVTVFTKSVPAPVGFALACQTDKGLLADADYMAIRRAEDLRAAAHMSITAVHWLDLPEAPHRFYHSAPELFGSVHPEDSIGAAVALGLIQLAERCSPDLIIAPQVLGNHVDHQIVTKAILGIFSLDKILFYRDAPYAIRQPQALPLHDIIIRDNLAVDITATLNSKIAAASAYATQIGYQFGGAEAVASVLREFALSEGNGHPAERFIGAPLPLQLLKSAH